MLHPSLGSDERDVMIRYESCCESTGDMNVRWFVCGIPFYFREGTSHTKHIFEKFLVRLGTSKAFSSYGLLVDLLIFFLKGDSTKNGTKKVDITYL